MNANGAMDWGELGRERDGFRGSLDEDDDAEEMESSIVTNQNGLTYWTNFDVPTDYIALLLLLGTISCLILGVMALGNDEE